MCQVARTRGFGIGMSTSCLALDVSLLLAPPSPLHNVKGRQNCFDGADCLRQSDLGELNADCSGGWTTPSSSQTPNPAKIKYTGLGPQIIQWSAGEWDQQKAGRLVDWLVGW